MPGQNHSWPGEKDAKKPLLQQWGFNGGRSLKRGVGRKDKQTVRVRKGPGKAERRVLRYLSLPV